MRDLNGQKIQVGDKVAYATRGSIRAYLYTGVVVELTERDKIRVKVDGRGDAIVTVGHGYRYGANEACESVFVYQKGVAKRKRSPKKSTAHKGRGKPAR